MNCVRIPPFMGSYAPEAGRRTSGAPTILLRGTESRPARSRRSRLGNPAPRVTVA